MDDSTAGEQTPPLSEMSGVAARTDGLLRQEQKIALLLIDGSTQYDISRRLHLPSGEVGRNIKAIREKIGGSKDTLIAAVAEEYKLTRRETE